MKKYFLAFICLLILMLIVGPIITMNAMAEENNSTESLDIEKDIERDIVNDDVNNLVRDIVSDSGSDIESDVRSDIGSKIEQYVDDHCDTTAGMSVAVFNENETIYKNCFGYMDIRNRIPVTEDTVMEWGSVSKLLVWVSVMQLEEQGLIDLEADINTYLPEGFLHNRTYEAPVTMLNLMNHDAGFEEIVIGMATGKEERIISLEEYLSEFQPRQIFEPGTVCAYSNWSTTLAAYIVECVSGVPYYEYVRTNIFEPLEMNDTSICADLSDNLSVKERRLDLRIYTTDVHEITPNMSYIIMYPAGMCISTIGDMQKFAQSLLLEDTVLFHDKETYHELFSPSLYYEGTDIPKNCHGFWAFQSYGTSVIGHNGNTAGCSSSLLLDMENHVGIVIQTNQYAEQIYNMEMPELLFGKYEGTGLDYAGPVMAARTIFHGPLKLYRLLSVTNIEQGEPVIRTDESGIDKISCIYGDYLIIGFGDIALDVIVIGLYLLILIYCLVNIIRSFIMGLIGIIKKKNEKRELELWCAAGNLIPFVPVAIFALMIPTLFNFQQWPIADYRFALFLIFLSVPVMLALIIYGFIKLKNSTMKKSRRIYIHSINIGLVVTIVNIIYWNWCMFWMI